VTAGEVIARFDSSWQELSALAAANTYDHYVDHVKWIEELTESQARH
jgi:hypothetical protein